MNFAYINTLVFVTISTIYMIKLYIFKLEESLLIWFLIFVEIYKNIVSAKVDEKFKCKVQVLMQKRGCAETFVLVQYCWYVCVSGVWNKLFS